MLNFGTKRLSLLLPALLAPVGTLEAARDRNLALEEVIVTAQKREQSLQEAPIAISVLDETQLAAQGVTSLSGLIDSTVSSLQIRPHADEPTTLVVTIRGNGPGDIVHTTRESPVAVYLDDIYLGRAQGLGMELADLERIEVLRGPQGTLFGRNATAGAISLVSRKPSGEWGIEQTLGIGRFQERRSVTHIDLPQWNGLSTRFSYLHSERDGWVDNTAAGAWDYNAYNKDGGRLSLNWQPGDTANVDYAYDRSAIEASQLYYQIDRDLGGAFADEPGRRTRTRFPIAPLEPTVNRHSGHRLTVSMDLTERLTFKSLSSYRHLDNEGSNNFGGAFYYNGLVFEHDVDHTQASQEFRLVGHTERVEYAAGLYYYRGETDAAAQQYFSLDIGGSLTGAPLTPIDPPTTTDPYSQTPVPPRYVESESTSIAIYGNATWTPAVLNDRFSVTLGMRYTRDESSGDLVEGDLNAAFDETVTHTDPTITFSYQWAENISTYLKWATAFRSGGANSLFSREFDLSGEEEVVSYEFGLKSEFWNRRARLNAAVFQTDYSDMIVDVFDPATFAGEIVNARHKVEVDGAELDFTLVPVEGLTLALSYTYLDGQMPPQPNPFDNNAPVAFELAQTPRHAGALSVDYTFAPWRFGTLTTHLDVTSTDTYHYFSVNAGVTDAYTLTNVRVSLTDIPFSGPGGSLTASLWADNVTDEEYVTSAFFLEGSAIIKAYGTPRTFGLDVTYAF